MLKSIISRLIPQKVKRIIWDNIHLFHVRNKMLTARKKNAVLFFLIATPTHGNLGDQAIVYAQYKFLNDNGFGHQLCEITTDEYTACGKWLEKSINAEDVIIIDGGGSMGTLWIQEEYKMRNVVTRFPENKIVIFPQTVFFSSDKEGKIELQKSIATYSHHENLYICAREETSFNFIRDNFKNNCTLLIPDMVLYLNNIKIHLQRQDALLCLRQDKEKTMSNTTLASIIENLKKRRINCTFQSTIIEGSVLANEREDKLFAVWEKFSSAKIIITDRLHGMIFAAITSTPCLAFNNSSGKVKGVYQWLHFLNYMIFCEDNSEIDQDMDLLLKQNRQTYTNLDLLEHYNKLADLLKE